MSKIKQTILKIRNGGHDLTHKDMELLLNKLDDYAKIMKRISIIANTAHNTTHAHKSALDTIKALTDDFLRQ